MKKILIRIAAILILLGALIFASIAYSNYRISLYSLSVVNEQKITESDIYEILKDDEDHQMIVMIYDPADENSIYLDEVLMKDISIAYNGLMFEDIYRVVYENTQRAYNAQIIKNTYDIPALPAIVVIEQKDHSFVTLDSFSWNNQISDGKTELLDFLGRNQLLPADN